MPGDVRVRPATAADAPAIQGIYQRVVVETAISFEELPPDEHEILRRMTSPPGLPWLVATAGDRVLGYAYSFPHRERSAYRWAADCSVYVAEGQRGRGVGRMLYEALIAEVRALGYVSLLAGITLPNPASVALHGSLGFQPVGLLHQVGFKHGAWHDVQWWQLLLSDPSAVPAEPAEWTVPIPR